MLVDNTFTGGLSINLDVIHSASVVLTVMPNSILLKL